MTLVKKLKNNIKNYMLARRSFKFFIHDWIHLQDLEQAREMMATMRFSRNLSPEVVTVPQVRRVLVIAPHPDDEAMGPGGTLLKLIEKNTDVLVVYLSNGQPDNADRLIEESLQISSKFKYRTLSLGYSSKKIPLNGEILAKLETIINKQNPDILFIPFCLDDHDDHRQASHLLYLLNLESKIDKKIEIWAYQVYTTLIPNVVIDITDVIDQKSEMIKMWYSQSATRNWAHFTLGINAFNQRLLPPSKRPRYAEAFFVLPIQEYLEYVKIYFNSSSGNCYYNSIHKEKNDQCR